MVEPDRTTGSSSGGLSRLLLLIRRFVVRWRPGRQPEPRPQDLDEATSRAQLKLVLEAFGEEGVGGLPVDDGRGKDERYLCHPARVLVRAEDVSRLDEFLDRRKDVYRGRGQVIEELVGDLVMYALPAHADSDRPDVHRALAEIDEALGEGVVRPDHIIHVAVRGTGKMCPATEPEIPLGRGPLPPLAKNEGAGKGVRVSVVDTGWYADAETNPESPWLSGGIEGDLETVNPAAIHPYAGHGTFVAGVIRCLAPATTIEVEGVLTKAGAVYESAITRELHEALTDPDDPDLISISAGAYTRRDLGLLGFERLAELYELGEGEDAVLVVAAAGNDSSDRPFWPAAYDWVLSVGALDADMTVSDFSNFGDWVDVYAHGRDLVNAFPTGTYTCVEPAHAGEVRSFTGLAQWSGTSFATPVVTGSIAAYMSEHGVSARAARDALVAAGVPFTSPVAGTSVAVGTPFA
jgi:subtilisin family serine protease